MNNQYINNSTDDEQVKGFNKTGVLLLKNRIDKIEYHLYNNKLPYPICCESVDVNQTLDIHLYNVIKKPIQLTIKCENGFYFNMQGKLIKKTVNKIDKYYFEGNEYIDIEEILFDNTSEDSSEMTTIKINTIHNEEIVEVKEGEININGLQES